MSGRAWVLAPHVRVLESTEALVVVGPTGDARAFEGVSGPFAREVLELLRAPIERVEVLADIASRAEGAFDPKVVGDLLDVLVALGAIVPAERVAPRAAPSALARRRVVLCVSGAIQAVEAPRLATILDARGLDVRVAMTDAAEKFVSALALEAITHARVVTSIWPDDDPSGAARSADLRVPHVDLARWADLVVVYPASATTISRIATGDCADVVAAIAITTRAPVIVAPSMNEGMLVAPAVQRNIAQLLDDGFSVAWPSLGVEVADAPGARVRRVGPALSPEHLVSLIELALPRVAPRPAPVDWDAAYGGDAPRPWEADVDDAPLDRALAAVPPPRALLDLGCGTGARALRLAEQGYRVVATDVSDVALERARARPGADRVVFLRDDVRATLLRSTFDVVLDRGCFHSLDAQDVPAYRAAIERLLAPGGTLVVVHDAPHASASRRTLRLAPDALAEALSLAVDAAEPATIVPDDAGTSFVTRLSRRSA